MNARWIANDGLLILPRLRIQNANAISSSLTHGFPSMTAFTGLAWALERKLAAEGIGISLVATGVICHGHQELVQDGYVKTFRLTRNPVSKDGGSAAIVEEGRIHLDITLIFAVQWNPVDPAGSIFSDARRDECQSLAQRIGSMVATGRIAGGTVLPSESGAVARLIRLSEDSKQRERDFRRLRRRWLPGFALVSRHDLLEQRLGDLQHLDPGASTLDAWLDLSRFNWRPEVGEAMDSPPSTEKVTWQHDRPEGSGWIVPIPVGYGALSEIYPAGHVSNARDSDVPLRFVESLYSIGQWLSPHTLGDIDELLWYADNQPEKGVYRVRNEFPERSTRVARV